jgi:hypothetical protein
MINIALIALYRLSILFMVNLLMEINSNTFILNKDHCAMLFIHQISTWFDYTK